MKNFLQTNVIFLLIMVILSGCSPYYLAFLSLPRDPSDQQERDVLSVDEKQKVVFHGNQKSKKIALTFDDGPDHRYTVRILDILRKHHVSATFFVLGKLARKNPQILKRMVKEGHTIGNHSWSHTDFTKLNQKEITQQLAMTNREIQKWTGKTPLFFRPPFGAMDRLVVDAVSEQGYAVIYWDVDTKDWQGKSADKIIQTVKKNMHAGSIILFHSAGGPKSLDGTIQALPKLISFLQKQGYELVTIDQLIDLPAYRQN